MLQVNNPQDIVAKIRRANDKTRSITSLEPSNGILAGDTVVGCDNDVDGWSIPFIYVKYNHYSDTHKVMYIHDGRTRIYENFKKVKLHDEE